MLKPVDAFQASETVLEQFPHAAKRPSPEHVHQRDPRETFEGFQNVHDCNEQSEREHPSHGVATARGWTNKITNARSAGIG
jgi:hypothetical protein